MDDQAGRRGPGRPPHIPSLATRQRVTEMVMADRTIADIAEEIGISEPTLRLHYEEELAAPRPQLTFPFQKTAAAAGSQAARRAALTGRPSHRPTRATREHVEVLTAAGQAAWQVAVALGISEPTLREHYGPELANGRARKTAEIEMALYSAAKGGNVSAIKAWLGRHRPLENPPEAPQRGAAEPVPNQPLGKKELANAAALTAHRGSEWDGLLPN